MVVNIDKFLDESEAASIGGGFASAPISKSPEVVGPISAVTEPTAGTLPTSSIDTQDHPDASTTGLQFEFQVPEDYDSGNLTLSIVYAMSTAVASPNNVCTLEVGAEIAQATTGAIDTATYALGSISLTTPDNLTDVTRSGTLLTIAEADFDPGDRVLFFVKRLGADGSDAHTGSLQIVDYMVTYTGQIAARRTIHEVEVYSDTDETAPPPGTVSSFDTLDFTTGVDREQKFQFTVPDNWDGASDFQIQFTYAMSTAAALVVRLETEGEVANVGTGAIDVLPVAAFLIPTTADTDPARTTVARTIAAAGRQAGDVISLKIARRGSHGSDTHTGDWQLLSTTVYIGSGPSSAVSILSEMYLSSRDFRIITGSGINAEQESADFGGDFELYAKMDSTVAAGRVNVEWQGKLAGIQTKIVSIKVPIKGTGAADYELKIFAEGTGQVYTSGLLAAPGTRTVLQVNEGDLALQPTGEKRFFVVVEATLDNTEELRVGTPFVRME